MTTATDTATRRVRIIADTDPMDPREAYDNMGTMVTWHSRYKLGDEQPTDDAGEWLAQYAADLVDAEAVPAEHVRAIIDKHCVILPLYLRDHSGLAMSIGEFADPWDSGPVGFIVVDAKRARENWLRPDATWDTMLPTNDGPDITMREYAKRVLEAEVETYDTYLRGDIYGFIVEERNICPTCGAGDWDTVDSCWGFYGSDVDTNGMVGYLSDDDAALARAAKPEYR